MIALGSPHQGQEIVTTKDLGLCVVAQEGLAFMIIVLQRMFEKRSYLCNRV